MTQAQDRWNRMLDAKPLTFGDALVEWCVDDGCPRTDLHAAHGAPPTSSFFRRSTSSIMPSHLEMVFSYIPSRYLASFSELHETIEQTQGTYDKSDLFKILRALVEKRRVAHLQLRKVALRAGGWIRYDSKALWQPNGFRELIDRFENPPEESAANVTWHRVASR